MTIETRPDPAIPVWAEAGDKVQPTNPEIQTGWPLSNVPPSRQRFNWILNACAQAVRYVLQRGIAQWAAGEDYPQNGRVQYNGLTFRALIDSPTSFPGDVAGEWEAWGYSDSTLLPRVDSILTKSVAGGVDVVLTAAEANNGILVFTGIITANINVVIPNAARRFAVYNGTTGAFTLGVKTAGGAALAVPQASSKALFCDGANTVREATSLSATTPAQFDDSTAIATTAFVRRFGLTGRNLLAVNAATNPALTVANVGALCSVTGTGTVTLPAANAVPAGTAILLQNANAATDFTLSRAGADNILAGGANQTSITVRPGTSAFLFSNGANLWQLAMGSAALQFESGAPLLGVNQTWQNLTGSRANNTTYTNATGRPIAVLICMAAVNGVGFSINGVLVTGTAAFAPNHPATFVIPPGATYRLEVSVSGTIGTWFELR